VSHSQRVSVNKKMKHISTSQKGVLTNENPSRANKHSTFLPAVCMGLLFSTFLHAQESTISGQSKEEKPVLLPGVSLIGSDAAEQTLPASGVFIGKEDLKKQINVDVNRVLRQVPGVYVREEDGMGLFPNISVRGVTTERSKAVTVMEDGILTAPAPYSAPSAYYIPNVGRMSGLEILKGSSQIKYGPHITGGVVNYLSTPIPANQETFLKLSYGSYNEMIGHFWHGDNQELSRGGRVGYLVEGFYHGFDGFKTIDATPDFSDTDDTGFTRVEPMVKLFWEPDTANYNRLELKYGYSSLDANETYLGLSQADFKSNPFRRYAASRFDNIQTDQEQLSLRHIVEPSPTLRIATTAYLQNFSRNWAKLKDLRSPAKMGLSQALLDTSPGGGLAILKGEAAGSFRLRNNSRDYQLYGIQTAVTKSFESGNAEHEWETGARLHFDEIDRFQWDVQYDQAENGTITDSQEGVKGAAGDRVQQSTALAVYTQDQIKWDRWSITPGLRFETVDQDYNQDQRRRDGGGSPNSGNGSVDAVAGGVSFGYELSQDWNTFFGVHRGFSMPGPRSSIRSKLEEETSWSYELGTRYYNPERGLSVEATAFRTDFNDLIVGGNIGGGGSATTENVGDIDSMGLELALGYDHGKASGWSVRTPVRLGLTITDATLDGNSRNTDAESLFEGGRDGAEVPYIPNYQVNLQAGLEFGKVGAYAGLTYIPETFTSASNNRSGVRADGTPDARVGTTDSYLVADLSIRYQLNENATIFGGIRNLFDKEYVASRHPHGPRPGLPRFFNGGVEFNF
jgi:Fe(3+) dicitrate transport protein